MNTVKNMKWYDLNDEEMKDFVTFIRTSLEKDATFKGMVKNVKAALHNSHLATRTYIPTLEANVLCEGQELLDVTNEMSSKMPNANDATNQRTKVSVGLPQGFMLTPDPKDEVLEPNVWMVELESRAHARSIAKTFSEHDVVVIGLEISGDTIEVHVAYKDEVENQKGFDSLPFTSKFLTRLMGYAA